MPIKNCELNGKPGYKFGDQGKCYTYNPDNEGSKKNAKKKAIAQGIAIGEYESVQKNEFLKFIDENELGVSIQELGITEEQLNDKQYQFDLDEEDFSKGDKVSFDYDDTLSTEKGKEIAKREIANGSTVYIISARKNVEEMYNVADELGIPHSRVYATGSNKAKVEKIKSLGIKKHIDNNPDVIKELGNIGMKFEQMNFSIIRLYKYTSDEYGASGVGDNTRDFCRQLFSRTKLSLMRYEDIDKLNTAQPGMGKGGSDSYSVFNWRGGNNCKHKWVKYLFDTTTNNLVIAPKSDQPKNAPIGFSFEETYNDYPKAASENAKKALDWIEKYGRDVVDAGTSVGLARANQLANGENLSRDTIARMAAFERHRKNSKIDEKYKGTPWKDKGYVAWLLWGGDEGVAWAKRKLEQIDKKK